MKQLATLVAALVFICAGAAFGASADAGEAAGSPISTQSPSQPKPSPVELQQMYYDAWFDLGEKYYDDTKLHDWLSWERKFDGKIGNEVELDAALKALTESLHDPWTTYQSSHERLLEVFASVRGLISLGMVLEPDQHGQYFVKIVPFGTLARKAGIQVHDQIESVGGKALKGLTRAQVDELLMVTAGPDVDVVYIGDGIERRVSVKTSQDEVRFAEASMLPGGPAKVLYARLSSLHDGSYLSLFNDEVARALTQDDADGMVLDLRGNPGGFFDLVRNELCFFLPGKVIVRTETRNANLGTSSVLKARQLLAFELAGLSVGQRRMIDLFSKKPIVVLVDGSTASAAEVLTGALQDNQRAVVLGMPTFRKGVGFDEVDIKLGGVMTITTLKYFTPNGTDVSVSGIHPQILVPASRNGVDNQKLAGIDLVRQMVKSINNQQ